MLGHAFRNGSGECSHLVLHVSQVRAPVLAESASAKEQRQKNGPFGDS